MNSVKKFDNYTDNRIKEPLWNGKKYPQWIEDLFNNEALVQPLCDHTIVNEDGVLVSEPYQASIEELTNLVNFCKIYNLNCYMSGDSYHEKAIRIELTKRLK